jgi:hypothetical protein
MLSRGHHTTIFIIPMSMLLLLKDLLAKFFVTCTLKKPADYVAVSRRRLPHMSPRSDYIQN